MYEFMAMKKGQIIGMSNSLNGLYDHLFNVVINQEYQGKGLLIKIQHSNQYYPKKIKIKEQSAWHILGHYKDMNYVIRYYPDILKHFEIFIYKKQE